MEGNCWR